MNSMEHTQSRRPTSPETFSKTDFPRNFELQMNRANKRIGAEDNVLEGQTKNDNMNDENSTDEENSESDEDESEDSEESDEDDKTNERTEVERNYDKKSQKKLPEINNFQKKSVIPDTPIENHPKPTNRNATSKLVIGLIVLVVYVSTMIITGGTVYAAYNWRGPTVNFFLLIPTSTQSPEQTYTTTGHYTTESGWSQSTSALSTTASMTPQTVSTTSGQSSTTTVNPLSQSQMSTLPGSSEIIAPNSGTTTSTQSPFSASHQNNSAKPSPPKPAVSNQSTVSPTTGTTLEKPESIKNNSITATPIQVSTSTEHSSSGVNESILVILPTKSPQFVTTPSRKPGSSQSSTTEYPTSPPKMNTTTRQPGANQNQNIPIISGTRCPYRVFGTCPPITNCTRQNDTCRPRPTQPCVPHPHPTKCPEMKPCLVCRDSGENKCPTTSTPKPTPPIDGFLKIHNKNTNTVVEWLNMYPPYSPERLIVVTTLLEETIERWALGGFLHRCSENSEYPIHETKCTFCNDRYKYIKCVMSNTLVGQVHPAIPGYFENVPLYHEPISFYNATMLLPRIVLTNHTNMEPQRLGFIFDAIERSYKAFHVKTENGGECRICEDFNRAIYNKCFSFDKLYRRDGGV